MFSLSCWYEAQGAYLRAEQVAAGRIAGIVAMIVSMLQNRYMPLSKIM